MDVFVVMGNDYPDAAFSSEEVAEAYCQKQRDAERELHEKTTPGGYFVGRVNWRAYKFALDAEQVSA